MKKFWSICLIVVMSISLSLGFFGCGANGGKITIVVDGGGAFAGYNSSISMEVSEANPYPYNTLEVLAQEYMEQHSNINIEINRASFDGARDSLVPLLTQKLAPDIIYQNGIVATEDLGKDFYVVLDDYLESPNPYVEGNEKWKDIYNSEEFAATRVSDGHYYFVGIDRVVNGMYYNKTLFEQAGITEEPETFKEFMDVLAKLNGKAIPYLSGINNYDLYLEGNLFNSYLDAVDVLNPNGIVDYEELARAVKLGIFDADKQIYTDYLTILKEKTKYYPDGFEGYDVFQNFISGKVGIIEVNGPLMMQISRAKKDFEVGYFPFPYISKTDVMPYGCAEAGKPLIGGGAGISTAWWVTNSAIKKGQEAVDAAVDFLMFLTAPQNNSRMVNDLGVAVPVSSSQDCADYFKEPMAIYDADIASGEKCDWHVFGTYGSLGTEYYIFFAQQIQELYKGNQTVEEMISQVSPYMKLTVDTLILERGWDVDAWRQK